MAIIHYNKRNSRIFRKYAGRNGIKFKRGDRLATTVSSLFRSGIARSAIKKRGGKVRGNLYY